MPLYLERNVDEYMVAWYRDPTGIPEQCYLITTHPQARNYLPPIQPPAWDELLEDDLTYEP